ncbi:MAG: sugar ABC transporter permease [Chloroflexi bacterium]|nr:sugar ABC transporter permease [Chloroflexota bacterium]
MSKRLPQLVLPMGIIILICFFLPWLPPNITGFDLASANVSGAEGFGFFYTILLGAILMIGFGFPLWKNQYKQNASFSTTIGASLVVLVIFFGMTTLAGPTFLNIDLFSLAQFGFWAILGAGIVGFIGAIASFSREPKNVKFLLLTPSLLVVMAVTAYPLVNTFIISFREWRLDRSPRPTDFVGLENYIRAFGDRFFWNSVYVTLTFTIISVVLSVVIGLAMALILQKPSRFNTVVKTSLIFPFAVAPALKGFSWRFMLNPSWGVYDTMLDTIFPFAADVVWLSNAFWAQFWLAMSEVWGWAPLIALMFIGALGSISPSIFEAAKVEGANNFELFWNITLPLLKPVIIIITLLKTIFSLKMFDQVVTMTGGGPGRATQTLNFYVYINGFRFIDMGYASALAYLLIIALTVFAILYVKALYGKGGV